MMTNSGSKIINYYKQFAKLTSGNQKDFWEWKIANAEILRHVKTDDIRKEYPEIDEYLKNNVHNVRQKECYKNAGELCINVEGVDYVEGEISFKGIPIEHAWNKIDGKYFDITKDILFPHNSDYAEYVKIIELDVKEYSRFLFKYKHWGGFILEKYLKDNHIKESYYPRLFEDVIDKARERMFYMRSDEPEPVEERDKVVAKFERELGDVSVIKNPAKVKNLAEDIRGVIDKEGNLYVPSQNWGSHTDILRALEKVGIIEAQQSWWNKLPKTFVTVQRLYAKTNKDVFVIGESVEALNNEDEGYREKWALPDIETCRDVFRPFIEKARKKNPNFKFYEYTRANLYDHPDIKQKIYEGEALSKYYERKFGIPRKNEFNYVDEDIEDVVAYVENTPIIKNPKLFEGFDSGVRIIIDKKGNLYVAKYDGMFNHGMMANALMKAGEIDTIKYNEKGKTDKELAGIYDDQKNFLLVSRLHNTNKIIQSDTFEWEGKETELLIKRLKNKHPQFEFYLRYSVDDDIE